MGRIAQGQTKTKDLNVRGTGLHNPMSAKDKRPPRQGKWFLRAKVSQRPKSSVEGTWRIDNVVFPEHHDETICPLIYLQTKSNLNLILPFPASMLSTPTHYTDLYPKQGGISGSNDQALGKGEDVLSYVIGCFDVVCTI